MVAGIYFMKNLMLNIFTKLLLRIHSKTKVSLLFCFVAAFLSAFLDALTVTAVLIAVGIGFYRIFHVANSGADFSMNDHNILDDSTLSTEGAEDLENFKSFLRDLIMHGVVGTALGGVCTIVGEPQNLLIANIAEWEFIEFAVKMAPITVPVFIAGMITCFSLEKFRLFGFGTQLPLRIKNIFHDFNDFELSKRTEIMKLELAIEMTVGILLILALAFHLAAVGIIGLGVIILLTSFKGITDEHDLGDAFKEALPFTALLVVFFAIVSVIADQELFSPIIIYIVNQSVEVQAPIFFVANGVLSAISDNVFVATIYINEIKELLDSGKIVRDQFDDLAVAINTGTNIPSIATPNGQAAFLFLLTSSLAPLIGLSYFKMVKMALPYTIVLSIVGLVSVIYFL
jgi:NhaB family Na+:H+ antiporter